MHWGRSITEYLDDACRAWLGYALPPPAEVIDLADWTPDPIDAFCTRCGESVGRGEATAAGCAACHNSPLPHRATVRLGAYAPPLDTWVTAIKYQRWAVMAEVLGRHLAGQVRRANVIDPDELVIVPMPMPWQRRLYRGIDHAGILAQAVARAFGAPVMRPLIRRNGPPQVGRTSSERKRGSDLGFALSPWWRRKFLRGVPVLLVDDVRTTGTSLRRAAQMLRRRQAGDITCAVIGVADAQGRRRRRSQPATRGGLTVDAGVATGGPVYVG